MLCVRLGCFLCACRGLENCCLKTFRGDNFNLKAFSPVIDFKKLGLDLQLFLKCTVQLEFNIEKA